MRKTLNLIFCLLFATFASGCNEEQPTIEEESKTEVTSTPIKTITDKLTSVDIEVGETYNISSLLNEYDGIAVSFENDELVEYDDGVITGLNIGITNLILHHNGYKQNIILKVHEKGALNTTFTFDEYRLAGKKIVAFGDSGTANATVGGKDTYYNLFADYYKMVEGGNFAIGGTTATYGYKGSNIHKEYAGTKYYGGPQRIIEVYNNGQLADVDYVILSYVGNDRYFQVPIEDENASEYNVDLSKKVDTLDETLYESAHSFKGSYRHMIKTLRQINPNVRIIVLNYHYSEFDLYTYARYGSKYHVEDYRKAVREVADEMNVKYLNPWQHTKNYYDYGLNGKGALLYYQDCVHMSPSGHEKFADYLVDGGASWYLVGSMNNWQKDIDYQFAKYGRKYTFSIRLSEGDTFKVQSEDGSKAIDATNDVFAGLTNDDSGNFKVTQSGIYTFVISKSNNELTVEREFPLLSYAYGNNNSITIKAFEIDNNGVYTFKRKMSSGNGITLFYDGKHLSPENITFEGKFNNTSDATLTDELYIDPNSSFRYLCSYNGTLNYIFTYNPEINKVTISLA